MKKQNKAGPRKLPAKSVNRPAKVIIRKLPTGVRGLDDILGGGIPEFSFNIIAGTPGCGKTTMASDRFRQCDAEKTGALFHCSRRTRRQDDALSATIFVLRRIQIGKSRPLY